MEDELPVVAVTVDVAVFTVVSGVFRVVLVRRAKPPFRDKWALPGGFLEPGENLDQAAARELEEETGLGGRDAHVRQFRSYGEPDRDPRATVVTVCYLALVPAPPEAVAGGDAADVGWRTVSDLEGDPSQLAFDHAHILSEAAEHARTILEHTTVAAAFCGPIFTIRQLRQVYEAVWGVRLDARNFARKLNKVADFLVPTGEMTTRDGGRPAMLYRAGDAESMRPPMYR